MCLTETLKGTAVERMHKKGGDNGQRGGRFVVIMIRG
jgi:hypothetical protein